MFQGFPGGSAVKNLPAMQETWILSLGWEDLLEKEMATHSCLLAWEIPWTEEPGGLWSMGSQESDTTEHTHGHIRCMRSADVRITQVEMVMEQLDTVLVFRGIGECHRENHGTD